MDGQALRRRYIESLFDRIGETTFPSNELLDRVEANLATEDELTAYGEILVEKVENTQFPSSDLLRRLDGVVSRFAVPNESG